MDKIKHSYMILVVFSTFFMGLIVYSVQWPSREIAFVSYEPDNGKLCAESLKQIEFKNKNWNKNLSLKGQIEEAFTKCLSGYIQLKTISPRGDEHLAVDFFETVFRELNILHKRFYVEDRTGLNKERVNIIATVPHDRRDSYDWSKKQNHSSVLLLNHMDVVDAIDDQWEDPLLVWSGAVKNSLKHPDEKFIWGRGALDMKGIAITQLVNMWILKQLDTPLEKDIHFLAVADEEQSGSGAIGTLKKMSPGGELFALNNTSIILNEGGGGMRNTPSDKWNLFLIAVEEKGGAWMEMSNEDPVALIKNLFRTRVINVKDLLPKKKIKFLGHECRIISIDTPKSKVNIVASKINAEFECKEGFQIGSLFESVFSEGFETVEVEVTQVGRKVFLTLETHSASHGAIGVNESAITAFVMGLHYLDIVNFKKRSGLPSYLKPYQTSATKMLVRALGKSNFILRVVKNLTFIPFIRKLVLETIEGEFGIDGLFSTTCQFSALNYKTEAKALVDCRLLHTAVTHSSSKEHPNDFIKELYKTAHDKKFKIELLDGWNVSQSSVRSKDYKLIIKTLKTFGADEGKKIMPIPYLFPAGTDSTWFRNPWSAGVTNVESIPSYGFFPIFIDAELLGSFHGSNERFPLSEIHGTIARYFAVLEKIAEKK